MKPLRRILALAWLALALAIGQQAVVLHDLRHAVDDRADDPRHHAPAQCDEHFACAQLAGAVGATASAVSVIAAAPPRHEAPALHAAAAAPRFAFRARAPPAFPA